VTRSAYTPALDDGTSNPVFLRLAHAVAQDIRRGVLRPGERLPGSRALADRLAIHRNTVLAAMDELRAEGWIRGEPGSGMFVAVELPRPHAATREKLPAGLGFPLPDAPPLLPNETLPPGALSLAGGRPDLRLLPLAELARAYRRALATSGRRLLDYGDPRGEPRLRAALGTWLAEQRGLAVTPDDLLVTRGSQQALALAARVVLRPGDRVAVEAFGYRPAWEGLRAVGAVLVPIPVDRDGLDVEALARAHASAPIRAAYVTPHHQYPTGAVLSPSRRMALLALATAERFAVFEDDYDHEFHYRGRPILPVASADRAGVVIYVGTLSKAFAPGVRLGFLAGPRPVLERAAHARMYLDRQGDRVVETAVADLLEDGTLLRHVRRTQQVYQRRRDTLIDALRATFPGMTLDPPPGGMALWCGVDVDADRWARAALAEGVGFVAGSAYTFDGAPVPFVRLGFAGLNEEELRESVRRMARARERL
jgi:GntR family transcriptional regulator/MocR family aminotransferase